MKFKMIITKMDVREQIPNKENNITVTRNGKCGP